LEVAGCKSTAAAHFSPNFCSWAMGQKFGENCSQAWAAVNVVAVRLGAQRGQHLGLAFQTVPHQALDYAPHILDST
jgi:hypothetical protein